jgi:hypothetical protein
VGPYCMIVGTELALHREVLAGTIGHLRPDIALHTVAPEELAQAGPCREPRLVIASDCDTIARFRPYAWILLFPGETDLAIASIEDTIRSIANASIDDILTVIDESWS